MSNPQKTYNRFSIAQRIEHFVLILSFTTLALTGIPQKFAQAGISEFIIAALGGLLVFFGVTFIAAAAAFLR